MWLRLLHRKYKISWKGFRKSLFRVAYIMGFRRELAYPSHRNKLLSHGGMSDGSLRKGLTSASTKNGSQQNVKALIMMPSVVDAFLSLASWNRSFFWWDVVFGLALVCSGPGLWLFGFWMIGTTGGLPSMGHCDSLLRREVKHCPNVVLSRLYCK